MFDHDSQPTTPYRDGGRAADSLIITHARAFKQRLTQGAKEFINGLREGSRIEVIKSSKMAFVTDSTGEAIHARQKLPARRLRYAETAMTMHQDILRAILACNKELNKVNNVSAILHGGAADDSPYQRQIERLERLVTALQDHDDHMRTLCSVEGEGIALQYHFVHGMLLQHTNTYFVDEHAEILSLAKIWAKNDPPEALIKGCPRDPHRSSTGKNKSNAKKKQICAFHRAIGRCPVDGCKLRHTGAANPRSLSAGQRKFLTQQLEAGKHSSTHADLRAALANAGTASGSQRS